MLKNISIGFFKLNFKKGAKSLVSYPGAQKRFFKCIFLCRLSLYFVVRQLGQAVGWSGNPEESLPVMISIQLLAKSRELWGKPLFLLCCGECKGYFSEMQAELNIVTQEITWVRPFLLQKGKRDEGMKNGSGRCRVWHLEGRLVIQVFLLPQTWKEQPGAPQLWHRVCPRAGATALQLQQPAATALTQQQPCKNRNEPLKLQEQTPEVV